MESNTNINCPNCGESIDVQDILAHQLEDEIKSKYQKQISEERDKMEFKAKELLAEKEAFEEKKKKENELFNDRLNTKLREEKSALAQKLKNQLQEEQSEQFKLLQNELNEKSEKIKELNRSKAEIEQLKREKEELKDKIKADAQKELNAILKEEKEKIVKQEKDRIELILKEKDEIINNQKAQAEIMQQKLEQGSMQLQGEVQELAIEDWLSSSFPLDTIEEIKKGALGGDCLQIVNTRQKQNCGIIYYESKRTKDFQPKWIEKFKVDIRTKGADIGVLITNSMPRDMDRMGLKDGVWVCNYDEFKGLCEVLRESIIQYSNAISSQENKGDKMSMLYDYLTRNEFKMQIEAIVEGFTQMQNDLESEKRSMQRIWKSREVQIKKVITNTIDMYASIKGIAGNAVGSIQALELPDGGEQLELN